MEDTELLVSYCFYQIFLFLSLSLFLSTSSLFLSRNSVIKQPAR